MVITRIYKDYLGEARRVTITRNGHFKGLCDFANLFVFAKYTIKKNIYIYPN